MSDSTEKADLKLGESAEQSSDEPENEITRAVATLSTEIERVTEAGDNTARVTLYAALAGLETDIATLVHIERPEPDPDAVLHARKTLRVLAGKFEQENALYEVMRYLLTDAPAQLLVAHAKVAIEAIRDADNTEEATKRTAALNAVLDASRGTQAEEAVATMIQEAKNGQR